MGIDIADVFVSACPKKMFHCSQRFPATRQLRKMVNMWNDLMTPRMVSIGVIQALVVTAVMARVIPVRSTFDRMYFIPLK